MKKYIIIVITLLFLSVIGITYSMPNNDNLTFKLIGPELLYVDVNTEYVEYGIDVNYNGKDISEQVLIDSSQVNMNKLGEYLVKYEIKNDEYNEYIYRKVVVIDKVAPVITLNGGENVTILLNGTYEESGYLVSDNYDDDLIDKVEVVGLVDVTSEGEYTIKYIVTDKSGNTGEALRHINVQKPIITLDNQSSSKNSSNINVYNYSNTVTYNKFNTNGVYLEGYVKNNNSTYKIKLKNRVSKEEYLYNMTSNTKDKYNGLLELHNIPNGVYDVYIISTKEEKLLNKLNILSKVVRSKVGNKLVTFIYNNDEVSIDISDFKYEYDIVIDAGHGGDDFGATNGIAKEKDMNLKVSKYEKCRYESMGYRVHMIRMDDSYGEMMGNSSIERLDRRALAIGYYGSVSKITYSNHHNSSLSTSMHGFELLVPNEMTKDELKIERNLYNNYKSYYDINDDLIRVYTRDYGKDIIYNKLNGDIYDITNYYAIIRIPYELYNTKTIIFEPIYMSNSNDFNWYWINNKWIDVSEIKIQAYVNYLGGTYNKDNSMCI